MPNAASVLILVVGAASLAACSKPQANRAETQDVSVEGNLAYGQLPPNAEIETLPPDESSEDTNGELTRGDDNPDVNDLGNSH